MNQQATFEAILKGAIQGEVESYELYTRAVALAQEKPVQDTLRELAQEELAHKAALERLVAGPATAISEMGRFQATTARQEPVTEPMPFTALEPTSTMEDVCAFAARKEQQAYELYRSLAARNAGEIGDVFLVLAQEELRHKRIVEGWLEELCQEA
jgi:rubrerythrin